MKFEMNVLTEWGNGDKEWVCTRLTGDEPIQYGSEVVIPDRDITINYGWGTYVCSSDENDKDVTPKVYHRSRNPNGWTRTALRTAIRKDHERFDREDMIWGHYLDDMFLEELRYSPKTKTLRMSVGS